MELHQHKRLSHPRGRLKRSPRTRLHPRRRICIRRPRHPSRLESRRFRAKTLLLLELRDGLFRGGSKIPCCTQDLGTRDERKISCQGPALIAPSYTRSEFWSIADLAATPEQYHPYHDRSLSHRDRRDPVPPYELVR